MSKGDIFEQLDLAAASGEHQLSTAEKEHYSMLLRDYSDDKIVSILNRITRNGGFPVISWKHQIENYIILNGRVVRKSVEDQQEESRETWLREGYGTTVKENAIKLKENVRKIQTLLTSIKARDLP